MSGLGLLRVRMVSLATVIAALLATGTWFALTRASAEQGSGRQQGAATRQTAGQASGRRGVRDQPQLSSDRPLRVISVSPASAASGVNGAEPVRIVFSEPLAADSPLPTLTPRIGGTWQRGSGGSLEFLPARGFAQGTAVRLKIQGGTAGVKSAGGGLLAKTISVRFRVGTFVTLRLQQLLAQLGYLPLTWTPLTAAGVAPASDVNAQLSAAFSPPLGEFTMQPGYPKELATFWTPGRSSLMLTGAVMAFEADHGMPLDGVVGPAVWKAALRAFATGSDSPHGYTYARASETSPEALTIWHDGHVVLRSLANTGAPVAPTTIGTAPVYLRYRFQIMKGLNPDGTKYADPVSFVSYFRAGEAVHYFSRGSYGFPQSLGCVELPYRAAERAWPYLTYGSLVTVAPPS